MAAQAVPTGVRDVSAKRIIARLADFRDPLGLEESLPKIQGRELRRLKRLYRRCWGVPAGGRFPSPTSHGWRQNAPQERREDYLAHWQTEELALAYQERECPF